MKEKELQSTGATNIDAKNCDDTEIKQDDIILLCDICGEVPFSTSIHLTHQSSSQIKIASILHDTLFSPEQRTAHQNFMAHLLEIVQNNTSACTDIVSLSLFITITIKRLNDEYTTHTTSQSAENEPLEEVEEDEEAGEDKAVGEAKDAEKEKGNAPQAQCNLTLSTDYAQDLLHRAIQSNNFALCSALLRGGANPNMRYPSTLPLHGKAHNDIAIEERSSPSTAQSDTSLNLSNAAPLQHVDQNKLKAQEIIISAASEVYGQRNISIATLIAETERARELLRAIADKDLQTRDALYNSMSQEEQALVIQFINTVSPRLTAHQQNSDAANTASSNNATEAGAISETEQPLLELDWDSDWDSVLESFDIGSLHLE